MAGTDAVVERVGFNTKMTANQPEASHTYAC